MMDVEKGSLTEELDFEVVVVNRQEEIADERR